MRRHFVPITTTRLVIRALTTDDLVPVFDTLGPDTSGGRVFEKQTLAEAKLWLGNRMAEQAKLGYSIWAVETKDCDFVGLCGLIPSDPAPMICYAIRKPFQGNGYGTEAAQAVIAPASQEFGTIISTIRATNAQSIRVAEKIGMRVSETALTDDPMLRSFVYP